MAMNKHLKVELDDASAEIVERKLGAGDYASAEDVVRASLRLLDAQDEIDTLRAALIKGEQSGAPRAVDKHALLEQLRREAR
jgi:antitoxin ParD1/3/4